MAAQMGGQPGAEGTQNTFPGGMEMGGAQGNTVQSRDTGQ